MAAAKDNSVTVTPVVTQTLTAEQALAYAEIAATNPTIFAVVEATLNSADVAAVETAVRIYSAKLILTVLDKGKKFVAADKRDERFVPAQTWLVENVSDLATNLEILFAGENKGTQGGGAMKFSRDVTFPVHNGSLRIVLNQPVLA